MYQRKLVKHHTKQVTTVSFLDNGIVSGGRDGLINVYNFKDMDNSMAPSKIIDEPWPDSRVILNQTACQGKQFLACSSSASVLLFDSQGNQKQEYKRGDPYVRDQRKVFGHTKAVVGVQWMQDGFLSCSEDGTVRVWDIKRPDRSVHSIVCSKINQQVQLTSACLLQGSSVAVATQKGSLMVWDYKQPLRHKSQVQAHLSEFQILSMENQLVTRGPSEIKFWDIKSFKEPVKVLELESSDLSQIGSNLALCNGKQVIVVDLKAYKTIDKYDFDIETRSISYSQKLDHLAVGHVDGSLTVLYQGKGIAQLPQPSKKRVTDTDPTIYIPDDDGFFYEVDDHVNVKDPKKRRR